MMEKGLVQMSLYQHHRQSQRLSIYLIPSKYA